MLSKEIEKLKWDVRMLEINVRNGVISREEWEKYKQTMTDSAENVEYIEFDEDDKHD